MSRHRPPHRLDHHLDDLARAVARDLQDSGRGPPVLARDDLGRWLVRDAAGALVATVGVRSAPHRPGVCAAAWVPDGAPWTRSRAAA